MPDLISNENEDFIHPDLSHLSTDELIYETRKLRLEIAKRAEVLTALYTRDCEQIPVTGDGFHVLSQECIDYNLDLNRYNDRWMFMFQEIRHRVDLARLPLGIDNEDYDMVPDGKTYRDYLEE